MTSILSRAALMAGVITLAGAAVASAQTPPAPGGDGPPRVERRVMVMGGPGMHGPDMGGMHGMHGPMDPEKHAQHLRDVLQLRPDQEGALKAFMASMTPPAPPAPPAAGAAMPEHHMDMPKTTPERLAMAEKMMAEHTAMFKKHNDAIRAFYGQLSASQQKAFDALHIGMGMGGHGMHGPGGMGMGGPGRDVRVIRRGGPGGAGGGEMHPGGPGGGMFIIGGPDGEQEFEIDLDDGGDDADE